MDPVTLAATALTVLSPYLVKAGEKMAEKIGDTLPENAGRLWGTLFAKFKGKPAAEEAVTDLAKSPEDADVQAAFRNQLKKALAEDPEFLALFAGLLEKALTESIANSAVAGSGGVAVNVGGGVPGNVVIGDGNNAINKNLQGKIVINSKK